MMPVSQDNHTNDVRVKTVYSGDVMITYIKHNITLEEFTQEMVAICRFPPDQVFTMKWVDEEGDPCTISTQLELDEALRLYELNRDSELTVHGSVLKSSVNEHKSVSDIKMAWGYWSASSVLPDRGRSPRRATTSAVHQHPNPPTAREVMETHDESIIHTASTSRDSRDHSASPHSSSNGGHSHHHEVRHAVPASALFGESYGELSRRPSLDLGSVRSALASCSGGGTLSAGSTLTRGGTLADYLPPTPCPHHHRVYVDHHKHYEQPIQPVHVGVPHHSHSHASSRHQTDDEDDLEPAYATALCDQPKRKTKIQSGKPDLFFPNVPAAPGMPCAGEDRSIYRRGARRWRKLYRVNGHIFQAKRFNRRAFCAFCQDRIWGLGRQGFKCIQCKLLVHKKCHKLVQKPCSNEHVDPVEVKDDANGESTLGRASSVRSQEPALDTPPAPPAPPAPRPEDLEPGSQRQYSLEDFELIRVIGRGSYAKVLMVELKRTKRVYAMKVIKKALVTDDEDIDWVQTEKHVFETASNHPFLVGLHSCFQTPSRLFFVIEFVRGGDLMFHMQRQRRLPEEHARFYAAEISLALHFLHDRGVIYRDLKLDNVLLDHEGHIKLTDYGMCKEGVRPGDTTSTFCGTPNYIAPEILRGEEYGFSVDWWALGVLTYEMLAGRSPFDITHAHDNPDQNTEDYLFQVILEKTIRIPRSLSVKAASVLKGFLNKNPVERLGCGENGFMDIVSHPFFRTIEWEMLEQKQVVPPFKPRLEGERDLANFPPEFTDEPVHLTPDNDTVIADIDQSEFEGFEYVNPLLMSLEDCV